MTAKALSTILLRFLGTWFLFEALFCLTGGLYHGALMDGLAGVHRRWYAPPPLAINSGDFSVHDTYYVISHFTPELIDMGLRLTAGLALLLGAKPMARLLSRDLD